MIYSRKAILSNVASYRDCNSQHKATAAKSIYHHDQHNPISSQVSLLLVNRCVLLQGSQVHKNTSSMVARRVLALRKSEIYNEH